MSSTNETRPRRNGSRRPPRHERPALITGGAGFIGTNVAHRLLRDGQQVIVFDNLSRPGVERNLRWLREQYPGQLRIEIGDVRDRMALRRVVQDAGQVFHFAAQVAVTTSLLDPLHDFEVNARGTLNLLAALHSLDNPPPLLFTSTNKVYGGLDDVPLRREADCYTPVDPDLAGHGISEARPLDFHSPYGCSKGAADQYVLDYARTFDIPTIVFRMSCIYGPHQFGTEDQGWVAHFLIKALRDERITLFGDGRQVRDVLFVEDLVEAMLLAQQHMGSLAGQAFNMGGGPGQKVSLLQVLEQIAQLTGREVTVEYDDWRPGDQRYYVSDTRRFRMATGWNPKVGVAEGVARLHGWLEEAAVARAADVRPGVAVTSPGGGLAAAAANSRS